MDTEPTEGAPWLGWPDVDACTLPTAQLPLRLAGFDHLFATHLYGIERTGDTAVRMLLAGDADLAGRTRALADAESACCSFFTFTVAPIDGGRVAFDVQVPTAYADVLHALAGRAQAVLDMAS